MIDIQSMFFLSPERLRRDSGSLFARAAGFQRRLRGRRRAALRGDRRAGASSRTSSSAPTCSRCCCAPATRTGGPMSDVELRDELMTMLAAGHETTATGLAFAFDLLLRNPAALARLRDELEGGRRRLPRRRRHRDAAAAAGDRRHRAHADRAAHGRRLGPARPASASIPGSRSSTSARTSTRAPDRFRPERFLEEGASPTPGCRSAAASAAASAPRSPRPRWPR